MSALRLGGVLSAVALLAGCSFYDVDKPRPYPCDPDAGDPSQCPGGARCGLSGFCHAIGVAGPYACNSSADCEANEHCGVDHVCYDLLDAGAVDCASDVDCASGWRCGVGERCTLASGDALQAPTPISALGVARISPTFSGAPSAFQLTSEFNNYVIALAFDAGVSVFQVANGLKWSTFTSRAPVDSLVAGDSTVFISDALGVWAYDLLDGGSSTIAAPAGSSLINAESQLGFVSQIFSLGPDGVSYWRTDDQIPSAAYERDAGGASDPVSQLVALPDMDFQDVLALTPRGVSLIYRSEGTNMFPIDGGNGGLEPYFAAQLIPQLGSVDCGAAGPLPAVIHGSRSTLGSAGVVAFEVTDAGQTVQLAYDDYQAHSLGDCDPLNFTAVGAGQPCPTGATLVDYTVAEGGLREGPMPYVGSLLLGSAICRTTDDAGVHDLWQDLWIDRNNPDGGFLGLPSFFAPTDRTTLTLSVNGDSYALFDTEERTIFCFQGPQDCAPLTLFQPPAFVLGSADAGKTVAAVTSNEPAFPYIADFGFSFQPAVVSSCATVRNAPSWSIGCAGSLVTDAVLYDWTVLPQQTILATLVGSSQIPFDDNAITQPFPAASVVAATDGTSELVAAAGDRIYSCDISALYAADAGLAEPLSCTVKIAPLPEATITAFTVGPAAPDAGVVEGYAIAAGRLFHVSASNPTRWFSEEVSISDGNPIALWRDGARIRLGYDDGRVFAFPSGTQIAPTLPEPARQLASLCGTGYALTTAGLYQLALSADAPIGTWTPVPLDWQLPLNGPVAIDQAVLRETDDALFLFDNAGTAMKITDPACP